MAVKNKKRKTMNLAPTHYRNPLGTRYASSAMSLLFSDVYRAGVWRDIWIYLADEERKLGLPIKPKQIQALKSARDDIDLDRVRELESELKHDVMSHLKAFAEKAPEAEPIMHLGATSSFITDNAEAVIFKEASEVLLQKLALVLKALGDQMLKYKDVEMTGFTHFQPAQPVTLGKRLALWAQDLAWDLEELEFQLARFEPRGCKGTTGTQASFMILFQDSFTKVKALDAGICKRMGFKSPVPLTGQTLSRKTDIWFLNAMAGLASTLSKLSYDMRLMQHMGEVLEPFGKKQVGSSAMAYKRNPMLAERLTGLTRFLMTLSHNGPWTHATQWLERSLDDSSNRRLVMPEAFLTADACLGIAYRLVSGLVVDKKVIAARLKENAALFETERTMMEGTLQGGSRQKLHEKVRQAKIKGQLGKTKVRSKGFSGGASKQVVDFHQQKMKPILKRYPGKKLSLFDSPKI